ncbi:hypothetical protein PR048_009640 [Dryococelus australis]|uniref:Uncharacterized protein n=1 Tax=Dryococelus australis TaxID=614101 RepID=A0ABQ9I0I9_9NEOP|nr:hypothetical protein PR048_009640 [Dryococelus australis]
MYAPEPIKGNSEISGEIWVALNIEVLKADEVDVRIQGWGKQEIPRKSRRPVASSGMIPTHRTRINPCSPRWEASSLTTTPPYLHVMGVKVFLSCSSLTLPAGDSAGVSRRVGVVTVDDTVEDATSALWAMSDSDMGERVRGGIFIERRKRVNDRWEREREAKRVDDRWERGRKRVDGQLEGGREDGRQKGGKRINGRQEGGKRADNRQKGGRRVESRWSMGGRVESRWSMGEKESGGWSMRGRERIGWMVDGQEVEKEEDRWSMGGRKEEVRKQDDQWEGRREGRRRRMVDCEGKKKDRGEADRWVEGGGEDDQWVEGTGWKLCHVGLKVSIPDMRRTPASLRRRACCHSASTEETASITHTARACNNTQARQLNTSGGEWGSTMKTTSHIKGNKNTSLNLSTTPLNTGKPVVSAAPGWPPIAMMFFHCVYLSIIQLLDQLTPDVVSKSLSAAQVHPQSDLRPQGAGDITPLHSRQIPRE